MEVSRHVPGSEERKRTVLCDSDQLDVWWDWVRPRNGEHRPGAALVALDGKPTEAGPTHRYLVRIGEKELGEMLGNMPVAAVPLVIDGLLRGRDPEILGAVMGHILAHIARLAGRAASQSS